MAIKGKDDLLSSINERFKDDTSDDVLSLIEDISDTLNDYEERTKDATEWKTKYENNDRDWRKKYRDRFFNSASQEQDNGSDEEERSAPKTFDELFSKK